MANPPLANIPIELHAMARTHAQNGTGLRTQVEWLAAQPPVGLGQQHRNIVQLGTHTGIQLVACCAPPCSNWAPLRASAPPWKGGKLCDTAGNTEPVLRHTVQPRLVRVCPRLPKRGCLACARHFDLWFSMFCFQALISGFDFRL